MISPHPEDLISRLAGAFLLKRNYFRETFAAICDGYIKMRSSLVVKAVGISTATIYAWKAKMSVCTLQVDDGAQGVLAGRNP